MRSTILFVLLLVLQPCIPGPVAADGSDATVQARRGRTLYRIYCVNCHGESGRGDGPTARLLTVEPADLTRVAARNEGAFPFERIEGVIDGRRRVPGHGKHDMPIWGIALQQWDTDVGQGQEVARRVEELMRYLESIQASD